MKNSLKLCEAELRLAIAYTFDKFLLRLKIRLDEKNPTDLDTVGFVKRFK